MTLTDYPRMPMTAGTRAITRHRFVAGDPAEVCARCAAPQDNRRYHPRIIWLEADDPLERIGTVVLAAVRLDDVTLQAQMESALDVLAGRSRLVHAAMLAQLFADAPELRSDRCLRLARAAVAHLIALRRLSPARTPLGDPVLVTTTIRGAAAVPAYRADRSTRERS